MANKIHIKLGPIEFEAEGESELIERERSQFFSLLPQAITAVSSVVPATAIQNIDTENMSQQTIDISQNNQTLIASTNNSNFESLVELLREKNFSNKVEVVMGVAYYIDCIKGINTFTSKDIENELNEARQELPINIPQRLTQNIKKGYLREEKEKKDGLKTYVVLERGKNWFKEYKPHASSNEKRNSRTKTPKAARESPLTAISLDDLNLEKYCDVSQLIKFNEQMLVIMLIYTREKDIQIFSFNDIVSIFKTKFKIQATERKVRYAFDKGGTMFDKECRKKIAYHKLTNSGIKEAERIIAQQKADLEKNE